MSVSRLEQFENPLAERWLDRRKGECRSDIVALTAISHVQGEFPKRLVALDTRRGELLLRIRMQPRDGFRGLVPRRFRQ